MGVAPSTLSRTVTRLEALLGITLLRRSTRAIELTPEGRRLLEAAQENLRQTEALLDMAQGSRTPRGPLRVNAPVPFVLHVIAPRLSALHARFPQVSVTLDMTDRPVELIDSRVDLAIRFGPLKDSDVLHCKLGRTARKLCAAPAYLEREGWPARPADLAAASQVGFTAPAHINRLVFKGIGEVALPTSVQAENGEAIRALVLGGMRVARFSDYMVADDLAAGRLVDLFPGPLTPPPDITAHYLTRTSGLRRLAVSLDWLREVLPGRA